MSHSWKVANGASGLQIHFGLQGHRVEMGRSPKATSLPSTGGIRGADLPEGTSWCLNGHVHSKVQGGCHLLPEHRDSRLLSPFLGRSLPRAASASVRWVLGACPTPSPPPHPG